jgi:hypothetical protein
MTTQDEIIGRLNDLGIQRTKRVLTDWASKGLLPPMRRLGQGRKRGVKWYWDEDVLEQTIATHFLLTNYSRVDAAVLGLWTSGYNIRATVARRAWLRCVTHEQRRVRRAAKRYEGDYSAIAKGALREIVKNKNLPSPRRFVVDLIRGSARASNLNDLRYRQRVADTVADWFGLLKDKSKRDDKAYRNIIVGFIAAISAGTVGDAEFDDDDYQNLMVEGLTAVDKGLYEHVIPDTDLSEVVRGLWNKGDYAAIFRGNVSKGFVRSLHEVEMDQANQSLTQVRQSIEHSLKLLHGPLGACELIRNELEIMEGLGMFIAKVLISARRRHPTWPLTESIAALHDFAMSVKFDDLQKNSKRGALLSKRAREEWHTTTRNLSRLWAPISLKRRTP